MMAPGALELRQGAQGIGLLIPPAHECTSISKLQPPHHSPVRQTATEASSDALYAVACPSGGQNCLRWSVIGRGSSYQITPCKPCHARLLRLRSTPSAASTAIEAKMLRHLIVDPHKSPHRLPNQLPLTTPGTSSQRRIARWHAQNAPAQPPFHANPRSTSKPPESTLHVKRMHSRIMFSPCGQPLHPPLLAAWLHKHLPRP